MDFIYLKIWYNSVIFCQRGHFFLLTLCIQGCLPNSPANSEYIPIFEVLLFTPNIHLHSLICNFSKRFNQSMGGGGGGHQSINIYSQQFPELYIIAFTY